MVNVELIGRVERFIEELGVTYASFARNMGLAASTIYGWKDKRVNLSAKVMERIDHYLSKFGY